MKNCKSLPTLLIAISLLRSRFAVPTSLNKKNTNLVTMPTTTYESRVHRAIKLIKNIFKTRNRI